MCLYGSRVTELAARRDFLLQLELRTSRQLAKSMLSNMLPEQIVQKLERREGVADGGGPSRGQMVVASEEPIVAVLFCDIVDFHLIVQTLSPIELVMLLDRIWSKFDALSERHGIVKMETVGPTYMAVGGLGRDGCQPVAMTRMAFDCVRIASRLYYAEGMPLKVRIGLHCGPALSGVVGTRKPQFSLFGDTVNTAARMQSTGEPMGIQVSADFHTIWMRHVEPQEGLHYAWEPREVKAKGKGVVHTFFHPAQMHAHDHHLMQLQLQARQAQQAGQARRSSDSLRGGERDSDRDRRGSLGQSLNAVGRRMRRLSKSDFTMGSAASIAAALTPECDAAAAPAVPPLVARNPRRRRFSNPDLDALSAHEAAEYAACKRQPRGAARPRRAPAARRSRPRGGPAPALSAAWSLHSSAPPPAAARRCRPAAGGGGEGRGEDIHRAARPPGPESTAAAAAAAPSRGGVSAPSGSQSGGGGAAAARGGATGAGGAAGGNRAGPGRRRRRGQRRRSRPQLRRRQVRRRRRLWRPVRRADDGGRACRGDKPAAEHGARAAGAAEARCRAPRGCRGGTAGAAQAAAARQAALLGAQHRAAR